jgi:hypothetical protein
VPAPNGAGARACVGRPGWRKGRARKGRRHGEPCPRPPWRDPAASAAACRVPRSLYGSAAVRVPPRPSERAQAAAPLPVLRALLKPSSGARGTNRRVTVRPPRRHKGRCATRRSRICRRPRCPRVARGSLCASHRHASALGAAGECCVTA